MFTHGTDYKLAFETRVNELSDKNNPDYAAKTPQELNPIVGDLINQYVDGIGEIPNSYQLERLANLLLRDHLDDPNIHKMKHEESPVLSEQMQYRRWRKEVPLTAVEDIYDSEGKRHATPYKREHTVGALVKKEFQESFEIQKRMDNGEI